MMTKKTNRNNSSSESVGPKRVALYARVSSHEQATEGVSIEAQLERLEAWAKMKGYTVIDRYIDPGYSGKDDRRPEFQRLMVDARRGKFDIVAVAMLDRLMRNLRLLLNCLHELNALGITFESVRESLDTATPNGKFSVQIMGVIAEFERERIGERISDSRRFLKSQRKWSGGRPSYGYRWNVRESKMEIIEKEAAVVRFVYNLYVKENIGIDAIATRLNTEGYRTRPKRSRGSEESNPRFWHSSPVHSLLTGHRYAGKDEDYAYPAIVSDDLFEAAQRKLGISRSIRRETTVWLLQGRVACGICGHYVSARKRSSQHRRKYECTGRKEKNHQDGSPCCTLAPIPAEPLEEAVWRIFSETLTSEKALRQSIEEAVARLEDRQRALGYDETIDKELALLSGERERATDAYQLGGTTRDKYLERLDAIDKKAKKLQRRKDNLNPDCRLEVARTEEFIRTVQTILADGEIRVDEHGLVLGGHWSKDAKEEPIYEERDLSDLCDGQDPDLADDEIYITEETETDSDGTEARTMSLHLSEKEMADFGRMNEISMEQKRKLLERFEIQIIAYPDRYDMMGLLSTRTLKNRAPVSSPVNGRGGFEGVRANSPRLGARGLTQDLFRVFPEIEANRCQFE